MASKKEEYFQEDGPPLKKKLIDMVISTPLEGGEKDHDYHHVQSILMKPIEYNTRAEQQSIYGSTKEADIEGRNLILKL